MNWINKKNIKSFFLSFLVVQLYISIGIIPFLIEAGIPFYLLSFLGNLVFTPFLTLFLILSLVVFICLLFQYYPTSFITILDSATSFWLYILSYAKYFDVALYLKKCPYNIHFLAYWLPLFILYLIKNQIKSRRYLLFYLLTTLSISTLIINLCPKKYRKEINLNKNIKIIRSENNKIIVKDSNIHWREKSYYSYLKYTLVNEIIKEYGTNKIDEYQLHKKYKKSKIVKILLDNTCTKKIVFS